MLKPKLQALWQTRGQWLNDLKTKIQAFDIKPAKPILPVLQEKADEALANEDYPRLIKYLNQILAISPKNHASLLQLADIYTRCGEFTLATSILKRLLKDYPDDAEGYRMLGYAHSMAGKFKASAAAYQQSLKLVPNQISAQHFLDAVQNKPTVIAPRQYIIDVFDSYAEIYERDLLSKLKYCAHIKLVKYIGSVISNTTPLSTVLDLGCGTGLFGQELCNNFKVAELFGVDLSTGMLNQAAQKAIYKKLYQADISEHLSQDQRHYVLVAATDVFVYIGDLQPIFSQVYARLEPNGFFAFTVESIGCDSDSFKLTPSGRYQHSLSYLTSLANALGYKKIYSKDVALRKEYGNMAAGYLVLLQK